MTVLNTGSTKKFSTGWEQIFSGRPAKKIAAAGTKSTIGKKAAKRIVKKKPAAKKNSTKAKK